MSMTSIPPTPWRAGTNARRAAAVAAVVETVGAAIHPGAARAAITAREASRPENLASAPAENRAASRAEKVRAAKPQGSPKRRARAVVAAAIAADLARI